MISLVIFIQKNRFSTPIMRALAIPPIATIGQKRHVAPVIAIDWRIEKILPAAKLPTAD